MLKFVALILSVGFVVGCATTSSDGEKSVYYESSYNDRNRAPASLTPNLNFSESNKTIDPTYMQTQADYHFAMAESLSLEGFHSKAIEEFKTTLIYDETTATVPMRLAAEYVKVGMIREALEYSKRAVEKDPKHIDAKLLLGGIYSSMKLYPKAIEQYENVLKISPNNPEAPLYLGAVLAEQKQYDRAIKQFESLLNNPEYTSPHLAMYYIGRVRMDQQQMKQAETAYKKSIEYRPDFADAVMSLSSLYEKSGQRDKAAQLLSKFQKEQGPNARVAEALSIYYLEEEDYDSAFVQLEILEEAGDDTLNAKVKMALILIEKKIYDRALAKLNEILEIVPDSDKIRFYLGAVYEETKDYDKAISEYLKIPTTSQFFGESAMHAAYLQKILKKTNDAIKTVKLGIEHRADLPQLYTLYASLLDEQGEHTQGYAVLDNASKKFPENVQIRFFLGNFSDKLGKRDDVVKHMKLVLEMDPNHVQGLNYLAFTYAEMGENLEDAEVFAKRAIELDPKDGYIMDTLGWVQYKRGKVNEAIKTLEAAYKLQPSESIIAEHLGDAYYKYNLVEKARDMYNRAAETETDDKKINEIRSKISSIDNQQLHSPPRKPASIGVNSSK